MTCFSPFVPKRDEKDLSSSTELREEMEGTLFDFNEEGNDDGGVRH